MMYKIGIYSSGVAEDQQAIQAARDLGFALAQSKVIVVTGGGSGMPSIVAQAAKRQGAEVWGFTPARDASEQQQQSYPTDDIHIYDRLFFIPPEYDKKFFLEEPFVDARDRSTKLKCRFFVLRKNEVIESVLLR